MKAGKWKIIAIALIVSVFTCTGLQVPISAGAESVLTTVDVGEIQGPIAGAVSAYLDFTETRDDGFTVENDLCYWSDANGTKMMPEDTFVAGQTYYYTIVLKVKDGYSFASDTQLTIYGEVSNVDANMTMEVSGDTVTFFHAYKAVCGGTLNNPTLTTANLSSKVFVYNGKVQKPTASQIKVYDQFGKLIESRNYEIVYASQASKAVGFYAITIRPVAYPYEGELTTYYQIIPKGTTISKVIGGKKKLTVKWKKQATQTKGYIIEYSTSKKFTAKKTKKITSAKKTKVVISGLKAKKKYFVRIYTYNGKLQSSASKTVSAKTK